ncbi:putative centrosomin motif 1 [Plasmopara halstedii]
MNNQKSFCNADPQQTRESDFGGRMSMTPTHDHSTLLREQEAEHERLRMDNFNQALRINFLEERLLRMKQGTDFCSEELESELAQLRITLEERDHELRQRNFSMIRATEAIDMLNAQLHEAQAAAARAREEAQQEAEAQLHFQLEARRGADAEIVEKIRAQLDRALYNENQSQLKIQDLELELQRQNEVVATLTTQLQELQDANSRRDREIELRSQREEQNMHQVELANAKIAAEAEHWKIVSKQLEEQTTVLQVQVETLRQEKQTLDVRYQSKMKRMEQQVQHQMEQLQRESENYRAEHTRLLTDREKAHFEKERLVMEIESIKQERVRLQAEIDRMTKEKHQLAGDSERLRLQNVKLTASCEEQTKSLESYKADKELALDSIHLLESELHQFRKRETEYDLTIQTLESRLEYAETEARRMQQHCELAESRCQQTLDARLGVLEKDRQAIEEDNRRLRSELSYFQSDLDTMERKVHDSEERFSNEAANAQEQREHVLAYEQELKIQSAQVQAYQNQLAGCNEELTRRAARVQELEKQLADAASAKSSTSLIAQEQWQQQFASEKISLLQQLDDERRRAEEAIRAASASKDDKESAQRELDSVKVELCSLFTSRQVIKEGRHQSMVSLVHAIISSFKEEFKTKTLALHTRWTQHVSLINSKLERLSSQLCISQSKLEVFQRSSVHAKDANQNLEKSWSLRYEELRAEREDERKLLEKEILYLQTKATEAHKALSQASSELKALKQKQKSFCKVSDRDYHDLEESNRLLIEEVHERRRSTEHARKQYMNAVRENKELLKAIKLYKNAISGRDKDIEKYKATVIKYAQQLKRRVEFGDAKQTLLEQLEQTQYMITETYKRWETSPIVRGPEINSTDSFKDASSRMHLVYT